MARSTTQFIDGNTGYMSPQMFEETVEVLFPTKKEFSEFTGISPAQVQRYCNGYSAVPKSVALLMLALGMLRRNEMALPDLGEIGPAPFRGEFGSPEHDEWLTEVEAAEAKTKRVRPGPKPKVPRS